MIKHLPFQLKHYLSACLLGITLFFSTFALADCVTDGPTANAGTDQGVCANAGSFMLNGSVGGSATGGTWTTSGTGIFVPNANTLNAVYIFSTADKMNGSSLTFTLNTTGGTCPSISDDMTVLFVLSMTNANAGADQNVCPTVTSVSLNGSVFGAPGGKWTTSGTGTFSPNANTLAATYTPSVSDKTGSVTLTLTTVGGSCGEVSDATVISFNGGVTISSQPTDKDICPNTVTTFKVTATGTGLVYKWQVDQGSGFNNITDGSDYFGSASNTLTLNNPTIAFNGYKYRCNITASGCTTPVASNTATLRVGTYTLAVTSAPSDQKACIGGAATFSPNVNETNNVTYQWKYSTTGTAYSNVTNNTTYSGANTISLTVNNVTLSMNNYFYKLVVSNGCTTSESLPSKLLVSNITFTSESNKTVCAGTNTYFSTTPNSDEAITSRQWQVDQGSGFVDITNNSTYSGATGTWLSINSATASMNGYLYRMLAKSACFPEGKASNSFTLTVKGTPTFSSNPADQTICEGGNTTFSITAQGSPTYDYQWQVNDGSGFVDITNNSIYSTSSTATLTISNATFGMNNYSYRCKVNATACIESVFSETAQLKVNSNSLTFSSQSGSITSCPGLSPSFTASVTGTNPTYQWQVDKGAGFTNLDADANHVNVTSNTLNLQTITSAMDGWKYQLTTSNTCANATSSPVTLTVIPGPGVGSQPGDFTAWNGGNATFTTSGTGTNLIYKWQVKKPGDSDFSNINDGDSYSNTTTTTLLINETTAAMNGYKFRCVIQSDDCAGFGVVTDEVTLTTSEIKICMVTVDDASGKNLIVFEKSFTTAIDSFRVYRESNTTDVYSQIGRVSVNDLSTFEDVNSDPTQQPYLYKIAVNDINNVTSPLSAAHKTMHLTINKGVGTTWNLIWNAYEGITVNTYNIYRGLAPESMSLINSVSGNITSYTDNNAPVAANIYYQIEIVPVTSCNPTAKVSAFAAIKSNKAETKKVTGIFNGASNQKLEIYPNPAKETVTIKDLPENAVVTIYDLSGRPVKISTSTPTLSVNELIDGMYILEIRDNTSIYRMSLAIE